MKKLLCVVEALILVSIISETYCYGGEESVYQQIAKALWQLQMKGDINTALGKTEVWNSNIQRNVPPNPPRHLIQLADTQVMGPTTVKPTTNKIKRAAFARRAIERQVTSRPTQPISQPKDQDKISPDRIYSNKMNRNTARGYGSSLTKLIAKKIKFNPPPEPKLSSEQSIDRILGQISQNRNTNIPKNFIPVSSTPTINTPKLINTPQSVVKNNIKPSQSAFARKVNSIPVIVIQQTKESDLPSPSFSIVAPSLGRSPSSFRFSNKEVSNNQLSDKNGFEDKSGFGNDFKDFEINDVPQIIVEETPTTSSSVIVKEQEVIPKISQKSWVKTKPAIRPLQHAVDIIPNQFITPTVSTKQPTFSTEGPNKTQHISTSQDQSHSQNKVNQVSSANHLENSNDTKVSRSDIAIKDAPRNKNPHSRPGVQAAGIIKQETRKPQIQVVQVQQLRPVTVSRDVTTKPKPNDITKSNKVKDQEFPVDPTTPLFTDQTTTTAKPVKAIISSGSSQGPQQGSRGISRGSFRGIRPNTRGVRPSGRGVSMSRGSARGRRPIGTGRPVSGRTINIPKTPISLSETEMHITESPIQHISVTVTDSTTPLATRPITKPTTTTAKPTTESMPRISPQEPQQGMTRGFSTGNFRGIRHNSRGIRPNGRRGSVSRGSSRGIRLNGIGGTVSRDSINIPKQISLPTLMVTEMNSKSRTIQTSTPPSITESTTRQLPAMDTAQFARRRRPGRVVVSRGNIIDSNRNENPRRVVINERVQTDTTANEHTSSLTTTTTTTSTEQPPISTTRSIAVTTNRSRTRRPGMMSPEEKRLALRNFQG
ncbi:mucin-2-like [Saccostrea echinata]|uniref:mucin-2-like n=1 Tax=Saccostrea echinata TaxID=191078 RepID=UPI002A7FEB04|nr:mucin-2-like [Saccostrea echinata]